MVGSSIFDSQPEATANYNYSDIASGTSRIDFHAGKVGADSTPLMLPFTYASYPVSTSGNADIDFDFYVNKNMTIKGAVVVSATVTTNNSNTVSFIAYLRRWTGSTETEIQHGHSNTYTAPGAPITGGRISAWIDAPLTTFKKGEYIRVSIVTTGSGSFELFHNPIYTEPLSGYTADLTVTIPTRIYT